MHTEAARKKLFLSNSTGQRFTLLGASVDMNFAAGAYFGGTVATMTSTTRASSGYAQTAAGLLVNFAANTPRITDQGLLVEEARTNLFTYSQPLIANLASSGGTIANGSAPATNPLPAATQWLTMGGAGVLSFAYSPATLSVTTQYTISFLVKMADNSVPRVSVGDVPTNFDMALNIANNPAGISNITVTALAGNVYRVTGTATTGGSVTQNHGILQYADQSGKSFSVSQFQIEAGAFATSPILTSAGTATRAADVITLTGAALTATQGANGWVLAQTNTLVNGTGTYSPYIVAADNVNNNTFVRVNTATTSYSKFANTVLNSTLGSGAYNTGRVKTGVTWSAAGRSLVANNGTVATDANAPTSPTTVYLGSANGTVPSNGLIERITIGTSRLADATIKALSA